MQSRSVQGQHKGIEINSRTTEIWVLFNMEHLLAVTSVSISM
jgi:hypothetical protein